MFGFLGDPKIIASKKSGGMTGCALALLPVFGILLAHWVLVQNYVCLLIRNWDDEWCTGWWFQIFFMFIPTWGNNPIWGAYFSEGGWFNHQLQEPEKNPMKLGELRMIWIFHGIFGVSPHSEIVRWKLGTDILPGSPTTIFYRLVPEPPFLIV